MVQTVGQGHGASQSRFMRGQRIRFSGSTQENELSGKVTDARQGFQVLKRLLWRKPAQEGRLKFALKCCLGKLMQILYLVPKQAGKGLKLHQAGWSGKSMFRSPMDLYRWSPFFSQTCLDPSGLRDTDAVADECPGCCLIRREEANRSQSRVACLKPPHHEITLTHVRPMAAIDVEGKNASNLRADRRWVRFAKYLPDNGAILSMQADANTLLTAISDEGEMQMICHLAAMISRGSEALQESCTGPQRVRTKRLQNKLAHGAP
jgi:hypothetical protein